jgi:hypothetical protein
MCNPKWQEISEALSFEPGQKSTDRADIVVRVYNMKLEELLADIRIGAVFGPVSAGMWLGYLCFCLGLVGSLEALHLLDVDFFTFV